MYRPPRSPAIPFSDEFRSSHDQQSSPEASHAGNRRKRLNLRVLTRAVVLLVVPVLLVFGSHQFQVPRIVAALERNIQDAVEQSDFPRAKRSFHSYVKLGGRDLETIESYQSLLLEQDASGSEALNEEFHALLQHCCFEIVEDNCEFAFVEESDHEEAGHTQVETQGGGGGVANFASGHPAGSSTSSFSGASSGQRRSFASNRGSGRGMGGMGGANRWGGGNRRSSNGGVPADEEVILGNHEFPIFEFPPDDPSPGGDVPPTALTPEPSTFTLLGIAGAGLGLYHWSHRRRKKRPS